MTIRRISRIFLVISLSLLMLIISVPAFALEAGTYVTTVEASYENPFTNEIEDQAKDGGNVELGRSMVGATLGSQGLIEVESSGATYATIRLNRAKYFQNPRFFVSTNGNFSQVSANVTKDTGDYRDYSFAIPSVDAKFKVMLYVEPMGRDVIFFGSFGGLSEGTGDFVSTVDTSAPKAEETKVVQQEEGKKEEKKQEEKKDTKEEKKTKEEKEKKVKKEENKEKKEKTKEAKSEKKNTFKIVSIAVVILCILGALGFVVIKKRK